MRYIANFACAFAVVFLGLYLLSGSQISIWLKIAAIVACGILVNIAVDTIYSKLKPKLDTQKK
jgi:hypothetical protein